MASLQILALILCQVGIKLYLMLQFLQGLSKDISWQISLNFNLCNSKISKQRCRMKGYSRYCWSKTVVVFTEPPTGVFGPFCYDASRLADDRWGKWGRKAGYRESDYLVDDKIFTIPVSWHAHGGAYDCSKADFERKEKLDDILLSIWLGKRSCKLKAVRGLVLPEASLGGASLTSHN